jgi:tRNA A-37 threonylcarbamoyl transferase component Bud32
LKLALALALALTDSDLTVNAPLLLQVLLVGQLAHSGLPFIATRWVGERLQRGARLSARQLRSARGALKRLHNAGVVHVDIHAGNVLLDGQRVLFCDLARSQQFKDPDNVDPETRIAYPNHDWHALAELADATA